MKILTDGDTPSSPPKRILLAMWKRPMDCITRFSCESPRCDTHLHSSSGMSTRRSGRRQEYPHKSESPHGGVGFHLAQRARTMEPYQHSDSTKSIAILTTMSRVPLVQITDMP